MKKQDALLTFTAFHNLFVHVAVCICVGSLRDHKMTVYLHARFFLESSSSLVEKVTLLGPALAIGVEEDEEETKELVAAGLTRPIPEVLDLTRDSNPSIPRAGSLPLIIGPENSGLTLL